MCPALSVSTGTLRRSSPSLDPTSSSPGKSLLEPCWSEGPASEGSLWPTAAVPVPGPGSGAGFSGAEQSVGGAVSGEHRGSTGRSGHFLRQGARGSRLGVSPAQGRLEQQHRPGAGGRGFSFSARPISNSGHIRRPDAPFPRAPSPTEPPNQPRIGLSLSWGPHQHPAL